MTLLSRCLPAFAAALALASCSTTPISPEPVEFTRTAEELREDYPATQQLGIASLYGKNIHTSRDAMGRTSYLAMGEAVLVKKSVPAVSAKGPEIVLNSEQAVVSGRSVVKKEGLLYVGEADSSKIIIDGVQILFEGPHSVKHAGPAKVEPPAPQVEVPAKPAPKPASKPKPASASKPKPKTAPKPARVKPAPTPADRTRLLELMREPKEG